MERATHLTRQRVLLVRRLGRLLEGHMVFLGFVWLGLLVIELIRGLGPALTLLGTVIWVLFVIDFLVKFSLAPRKLSFLKENWLTILSLLLPALRVLRFVRVLRAIRGVRLVKVVGSLNRSMRSLGSAMKRRGLSYVLLLTAVVILLGAAGMYAFERGQGLNSYGEALWWTTMILTSLGSEYWPRTGEGKALCLLLAVYGFCVFGYITATLASFFVGRDAEEKDAPVAGAGDMRRLEAEVKGLREEIRLLRETMQRH